MIFADYVYVDDYGKSNFESIKKLIEKNKKYIEKSFYVVILNEYSSKLEFEDYLFIMQGHYKKRPPIIVGIAKDYNSAEKLVCSMIKLCLNKVGSLDYISYLASLPAINEEDKPKLLHVSGGMIDD